MARVAGVDLPPNKRAEVGLTYIYGIGRSRSSSVLKEAGVSVAAVRYDGTIHDFVLLNALRNVPSTEAAIKQINEGLRQHLKAGTI